MCLCVERQVEAGSFLKTPELQCCVKGGVTADITWLNSTERGFQTRPSCDLLKPHKSAFIPPQFVNEMYVLSTHARLSSTKPFSIISHSLQHETISGGGGGRGGGDDQKTQVTERRQSSHVITANYRQGHRTNNCDPNNGMLRRFLVDVCVCGCVLSPIVSEVRITCKSSKGVGACSGTLQQSENIIPKD